MSRRLIVIFCLAVSPLIFFLDTVTDAEITISILYIILIFLVTLTRTKSYICLYAFYFAAMTILSYCLSSGPGLHHAAFADLVLALGAIFSCAYLGLKMITAEEAAQKARSQVAETSRGASLMELAVSIAHEINQPLAATVANAGAAKRWLDLTPPNLEEARAAILAAVCNAERAGEVVHGMRRLASTTTLQMAPFDIRALLLETVDLIQLRATELQVHIEARLPRELPTIEGDKSLIRQAFLNVLSNALEALEKVDVQARNVSISAALSDHALTISIRDSGQGVPSDAVDRLFEPFYTTKPSGMGIGLALTRSIAENHDALVVAHPCDPQGMNFEFIFDLGRHARKTINAS